VSDVPLRHTGGISHANRFIRLSKLNEQEVCWEPVVEVVTVFISSKLKAHSHSRLRTARCSFCRGAVWRCCGHVLFGVANYGTSRSCIMLVMFSLSMQAAVSSLKLSAH
jgi:hypothetical protein